MSLTEVVQNFVVPPLNSVYHNLLHTTTLTLSAGSIAYVLGRYAGNRIAAVDPKTAMAFTAATTLIYLVTKPVFAHFERSIRSNPNWFGRATISAALSMLTKKHLNLDNTTYAKTIILAAILIGGFEYLDLFRETSSRASIYYTSDTYAPSSSVHSSRYRSNLRSGQEEARLELEDN